MKVYTKIVIDMETLQVIETECYNYTGPVAECKGGGGGSEPDKKYNRGMLKISERQQEIADEMFNYFKHGVSYNPNQLTNKIDPETGQRMTKGQVRGYDADAVVSEAEVTQQQLAAQSELIPHEVEDVKERFAQASERRGVVSSIYKEALEGVDVEGRVSEHRAGIEQSFKNQQDITNRSLSRMGIDPSSGRGLAASANIGLEKAKASALGETQIRRGAETENFQRKTAAAGLPV
jgi:hypothetical protein